MIDYRGRDIDDRSDWTIPCDINCFTKSKAPCMAYFVRMQVLESDGVSFFWCLRGAIAASSPFESSSILAID